MRYLLDTSVYSQPLKKKPLAEVVSRWKQHPESDYAVSSVVEVEVLYGVFLSRNPSLVEGYRALLKGRFPVLAFDAACAEMYAAAQAQAAAIGRTYPAFDLMIGVTALRHGLILATCNTKDFQGIDGLTVEDWSK